MTPGADPHVQLLDDARQAAAAASRAQRRVLRAVDEQDATLVGSLEELAEAATEVAVHTTVGRRLRGTVRALAAQHLVIVGPHGTAWVRTAAVTQLRVPAATRLRLGGGERPARPPVALADALRGLVERRARVEVVLDGGARVHGTALAAGRDVLVLREATGVEVLAHLDRAAVVLTAEAGPDVP